MISLCDLFLNFFFIFYFARCFDEITAADLLLNNNNKVRLMRGQHFCQFIHFFFFSNLILCFLDAFDSVSGAGLNAHDSVCNWQIIKN